MSIVGYIGKAKISSKGLMSWPINVLENYGIEQGDSVKFFSDEGYMALDDAEVTRLVQNKKAVVLHVVVEKNPEKAEVKARGL